jgi:hypothetical protein
MSKTLIGISGKKRRGKDTAALYLHTLLDRDDTKTMYWATGLKQLSADMLGLPPYHFHNDANKEAEYEVASGVFMTGRKFLQVFGTDCVRDNIHQDFWVFQGMKEFEARPEKVIIIPDTRFPNEYKAIKDAGGYVIRIERILPVAPGDLHESETALDEYDFDLVVSNNGELLGPSFTHPLRRFVEDYIR